MGRELRARLSTEAGAGRGVHADRHHRGQRADRLAVARLQAKLISSNPTVVIIKDSGHWLMEEKPSETIAAVIRALEQSVTAQK
jgi:pimeloyl-ACP methyl ester carboxylesterase